MVVFINRTCQRTKAHVLAVTVAGCVLVDRLRPRAVPPSAVRSGRTVGPFCSRWAASGLVTHRELPYDRLDGCLMVVAYTAMWGALVAEQPHRWSAQPLARRSTIRILGMHTDGERVAASVAR